MRPTHQETLFFLHSPPHSLFRNCSTIISIRGSFFNKNLRPYVVQGRTICRLLGFILEGLIHKTARLR